MRKMLPALLCVLALTANVSADEKDSIDSVKARRKVEAERVESEFASKRLEAYKLVRSDSPKLSDSLAILDDLQSLLEKDTSLDSKRRELLLITVKADMKNVRETAAERSRTATRTQDAP